MTETVSLLVKERHRWVDVIRVIGAFLVVLAHVEYHGVGYPATRLFYFSLSRIAVPLFFMASGFLLLSKEEPLIDFFKKRAAKVLIPFIVWSFIYILWKGEWKEPLSVETLVRYLLKILRGPRENHLWFFYALIGLYLATPVLRVFAARASTRELAYFCGLWFLAVPVLSFLEEFTPIRSGFELQFASGYTGYFLLGHLVGMFEFSRARIRIVAAVFTAVTVTSVMVMYFSSLHDLHTQHFGEYLSMNVILMSATAFAILKQTQVSDRTLALLEPFSRASLGIYLVHVIALDILSSFSLTQAWFSIRSASYMIPLLGALGYFTSFLVINLLQKVPVLRLIVP